MKDQSTVALRNSNSVNRKRKPRNRGWRLNTKETIYLFPFNVAVSTSDYTSSHGSMIQ